MCCVAFLLNGCSKQHAKDFSTPEGALLCLEDAYRAKDIEAAVRCKDFKMEARVMLEKLQNLQGAIDDQLIAKTAEVLELGFRKELEKKGFPDMTGVASTFPKVEPFRDGIVMVTEECSYPGGTKSKQRLLVSKTADGWRVLNPVD
jgi:hypothetical protein